jgi:hypothetical protein
VYNPDDPQSVEKYSCATTLSDMEMFVFPELLYALVLANTMSPLLWQWREDPWFHKMKKSNQYRSIQRIKQFIMNRFSFNLDIETWGLTDKHTELARFSDFIDEDVLAQSNALFGYQGDKYYFDIDIRRHFGLDKYTTDIIPYWKTETVEAMEAFKYKTGYDTGAGECVSLSTLYAAALFVLGGISFDDIYLMATPLHSQNFIDIKDGILTNNRRIVTKNMWFNGSELSAKAQRALRNERVTIVVHKGGYIHTLYPDATIDPAAYHHFAGRLHAYLKTDITFEILANFLRQHRQLQKCFQLAGEFHGKTRYIEAEKLYHYEHTSACRISDDSRDTLLREIDEDEYYPHPLPNRIMLNDLESFFHEHQVSVDSLENLDKLRAQLHHHCFDADTVIDELLAFCKVEPDLPDATRKSFTPYHCSFPPDTSWEHIYDHLCSTRDTEELAGLALMAYRDMRVSPWKPFCKAALNRNPVCVQGAQQRHSSLDEVYQYLDSLPGESIYDGTRMAQPDEVWNYGRGDGLEKALCFMNIASHREPDARITLEGDGPSDLCVRMDRSRTFPFSSGKDVPLPAPADFS